MKTLRGAVRFPRKLRKFHFVLLLTAACILAVTHNLRTSHTVLAASTSSGTLLAVNEGESTLGIIDPRTARQVAKVAEGGEAGHEVAASLDGKTAYVAIYGDSSVGEPGTDGRQIVAIDVASHNVVGRLEFGHGVRPHDLVMNPKDGLLYVTTELDRTITVIDPKTMKIVGTIPTGQEQTHMLVISRDGRFGYTSNVKPGSVSVLDMHARQLLKVIPVSANSQRISMSVDDKLVFTADQTAPRMAVIDTATRQLKSWIPLPASGYGSTTTQDGRWLLVGMQSKSQVGVIDLKEMKVVRTVNVPKAPHEIIMSPDGQAAYVSCSASNKIAVIQVSDWTVTKLIQAGNHVDGLAWASVGQTY